jgi:hypothetical protein
MSNFLKSQADGQKLLDDKMLRQVAHGHLFSIEHMSDEELRQSIVEDILMVTMWEKEFSQKLHFGWTQFTRFVERRHHKRINEQIRHDEICDLIVEAKSPYKTELRIRDDRNILQAAMDYCGCWYEGYSMPAEGVLCINRDALEDAISDHGGYDQLIQAITMDVMASDDAPDRCQ